jgi:hypothetical protein
MNAHPKCINGHVCQEPSGRVCVEPGCYEMAGTLWGPLWCPDHDRERLNRITKSLESIADGFDGAL